ncbi:hypothetical protein VTN96DRAFT_2214 [Rasamsonia emersonii]
MGMRTILEMDTGPSTVYYLGYPQTEAHRADPAKFALDTVQGPPGFTHTLGLLELCHLHGSEDESKEFHIANGNIPPHLGFGHLGFTVPDVSATVERLRQAGVRIVKELGVVIKETVQIGSWESDQLGIAQKELHPNYVRVAEKMAYVEDPNGYIIELVPQNLQ